MPEVETVELLWRLLPAALLVPFITFFLGRLGTDKERKLEYRTFIDVAEIEDEISLKNQPKKPKTKLITPANMPPIGEYKVEPSSGFGHGSIRYTYKFLKIIPFGKSILTSGNVTIEMLDLDTKKPLKYDIKLPILDINEEIFINLFESTGNGNEFLILDVEMDYYTQAGERMVYRRNTQMSADQELSYIDFHRVYKGWGETEIIGRNEGKSTNWSYT